jgi:hypothetical protein
MCWTQPFTRHRTTTSKTNNTTLYVLDTTIHKTQTTTHIVLCYWSCLSSSCVLCMVVYNTYSVVLFFLFVVVLCLVYGCIQHIQCCVIFLVCRRPVSCVWLCPTHRVLCYLSCLSSSVSCVWLCPTHILLCYLSCQDDDKQEK